MLGEVYGLRSHQASVCSVFLSVGAFRAAFGRCDLLFTDFLTFFFLLDDYHFEASGGGGARMRRYQAFGSALSSLRNPPPPCPTSLAHLVSLRP